MICVFSVLSLKGICLSLCVPVYSPYMHIKIMTRGRSQPGLGHLGLTCLLKQRLILHLCRTRCADDSLSVLSPSLSLQLFLKLTSSHLGEDEERPMSYIIKCRPNLGRQSRRLTLTSRVIKMLEGLAEIYSIFHFELIISSFITISADL